MLRPPGAPRGEPDSAWTGSAADEGARPCRGRLVVVGSSLAHVMVVGGTRREWETFAAADWARLAEELGTVVADAGGAWLTMRSYDARPDGRHDAPRRHHAVAGGRCTVIVDPLGDGRERFAEAMRRLPATAPVDEKTVAGVLYEPADVEPDLVVVLGPPTRLPPSLVWELAYGELVFDPTPLAALRAGHLRTAIDDYHGRRRRFGGLEDGSVLSDRPDRAGPKGQVGIGANE